MTRTRRPPLRDDLGVTIHRPLPREPFRRRPDGDDVERNGYGPRDPADEQRWHQYPTRETTEQWIARNRTYDREALDEVLRGLEITEYESKWLAWQSHGERSDVVVLASLLDRMYRAGVEAGIAAGVAKERERRRNYDATKRNRKEPR
jgi:hypothetical protein